MARAHAAQVWGTRCVYRAVRSTHFQQYGKQGMNWVAQNLRRLHAAIIRRCGTSRPVHSPNATGYRTSNMKRRYDLGCRCRYAYVNWTSTGHCRHLARRRRHGSPAPPRHVSHPPHHLPAATNNHIPPHHWLSPPRYLVATSDQRPPCYTHHCRRAQDWPPNHHPPCHCIWTVRVVECTMLHN